MAKSQLQVIRESLQTYADRGIFREFSESKTGQFHFVWLLHREMNLQVDTATQTLRFKQLLPGIPTGSALHAELKKFLTERHDRRLPEHRRVDRRRAEVSCSSRGGMVSISLKVKKNQYTYGVNRLVNLIHDLFVYLRDKHPDYLVENFDVPQE
ncbi:MAG: hypothetical protein AB1757_25030 [Acidobacteriota bacterium]